MNHVGQVGRDVEPGNGPKDDPAFDFAIDVHTTTSNMGVTLILVGGEEYDLRLAAFIKSRMPDVRLYYFKDQGGDHPYLTSVTPKRLGLEVGPIPHGLLGHDVFEQANDAVRLALDYIDRVNAGDEPGHGAEVEVFMHRATLNYPALRTVVLAS